jgi:branched-subunit amino acid ABC-type transport system permease component
MQKAAVFLGFVPWIVFAVVAGPSTWMWAALAALVCALVLAVPDWRRSRSISVLDGAGIVFFGVMVVLALVLDRAVLQPIEDRAQLLSSIVIAAVALGSLAVGRPFTEYYAKRDTPREYWDSPLFKRINRVLTALWGGVFVVNALCDAAVGFWGANPDVFNWVVPIVVIVVAVKVTAWYPEYAKGRSAGTHGAHEASRPPAQPA